MPNATPLRNRAGRDRRRPAGATSASVIMLVIGGVLLAAAGGFVAGRAWTRPVTTPGPGDTVVATPTAGGSTAPVSRPATPDLASGRDQAQAAAQVPAGPPPFEFEPAEINFGNVSPDTEMRGSFLVRNTTDQSLTILKMAADCKCTTIQDLSGTVIPPGESVEVTAVMEGRSTPGSKKSEIRFVFAGYSKVGSVPIHSAVVLPITADPPHITPDGVLSGVTALRSTDGAAFRILSVSGETPVYADDFDPGSGETRSEYKIRWDLNAFDRRTCRDAQGNRMPSWLVVETDHPDAPVVDMRVRHAPCTLPEPPNGRQWAVNLTLARVNAIPAGESVEFSTFLKWFRDAKPNDTIREVRSESDQFDATLIDTVREGDKITCRVRITPKPGHRGLLFGDIRFYGYTPGQSQKIVVIGTVVEAERQASR